MRLAPTRAVWAELQIPTRRATIGGAGLALLALAEALITLVEKRG